MLFFSACLASSNLGCHRLLTARLAFAAEKGDSNDAAYPADLYTFGPLDVTAQHHIIDCGLVPTRWMRPVFIWAAGRGAPESSLNLVLGRPSASLTTSSWLFIDILCSQTGFRRVWEQHWWNLSLGESSPRRRFRAPIKKRREGASKTTSECLAGRA